MEQNQVDTTKVAASTMALHSGGTSVTRELGAATQHWEAFFQPTQIDQPQPGGCPETAQGAFLEPVEMAAARLPAKQRFVQRGQLSISEIGSRFI